MAEYGDPDKPEDWAFIKTFSPYQNVEQGREVSADPVHHLDARRPRRPGHARKMVAQHDRVSATTSSFYENIEGGHGGAADNKQAAFMSALAFTFLWDHTE